MYSIQVERIAKQLVSDDIRGSLIALPEKLLSLRRLCYMPNTDVYDIELAVAKEPSFATYILKLANSALYGTGKIPCKNIVSVIKRLGMHSVSQYALTFALKKSHELSDVPDTIASLLRANWKLAWNLSEEATLLYSNHRLTGNKEAKKIDLSDLLMLAALIHTGRLAIFSDFCLQSQLGEVYTESDISDAANKLNMKLLPMLFDHWGLPSSSYPQLFSNIVEIRQALHAIDYLFAAALLNAYPKKIPTVLPTHYNFVLATFNSEQILRLATRLCYLQILSMDDLNFESIKAI